MDSNPAVASVMGWTPWLVMAGKATLDAINFFCARNLKSDVLHVSVGRRFRGGGRNLHRTASETPARDRRNTMNIKLLAALSAFGLLAGTALFLPCQSPAGEVASTSGYRVLAPIRHANLTVFPVVA